MGSTRRQVVIGEKVSKPSTHALARPRVTDRVAELEAAGVGYVHGAAGIGKTTALAQLADVWSGATAWVRLDHGDADESRLVALLESALRLPAGPPDATIDHVIAELEASRRPPTLIVFDDLHSIEGSPAEGAIHRLIRYRPPGVAVLMGSRHDFTLGLRGLVGSAEPMIIDFEDLRFRVWEVDDLMRSHHDLLIAPADLHLLCRYTDGWAAALRLFWVASRDAAPEHRSHLISSLRTSSGMLHDYLMSEVLSTLQPAAREFLVATAVFEQITPARADALLDTDDARAMLRDIHAAGLFGDVAPAADSYRCHELLRTHLLSQLTEQVGDEEAAALQLRAAAVAEHEGDPAEAIRYYARGGDFDSVRRILDTSGDELSTDPGRWIDVLPPAMRDQDPFVLLTSARQLVRHGDLDESRARYRRAVQLLDSADGVGRAARHELRLLDAWLLGEATPVVGWVGRVRTMLRSGIGPASSSGSGSQGFDKACAEVLLGRLSDASSTFRLIEETERGLTGVVAGAARLFVDHLRGGDEACAPGALRRVQQNAKRLDVRAVERLVGAIARGGVGAGPDDPLVQECLRSNDRLGCGLVHLADGIALVHEGRPDPRPFADAAAVLTVGDYDELALLARCFESVAAVVTGAEGPPAGSVDAAARRSSGLAQLLHLVARAESSPARDEALELQIDQLARRADLVGLVARLRSTTPAAARDDRAEAAELQVLGSFRVRVGGEEIESELTPLHQEVLAFFAVQAGEWVHKDRVMATFWPDKDDTRANRSFQVAVSKVRVELEREGIGTLERDGARYSLVPAASTGVDLLALRALLASPPMPLDARASAVETALQSYGELVGDMGALSWATEPRRELRFAVSRAAQQVAVALQDVGDHARAGRIAEAGVLIDSGADELWQIAIANSGAARACELQAEYDRFVASYRA